MVSDLVCMALNRFKVGPNSLKVGTTGDFQKRGGVGKNGGRWATSVVSKTDLRWSKSVVSKPKLWWTKAVLTMGLCKLNRQFKVD